MRNFFLCGFLNELVYLPSLGVILEELKNRSITAVNSLMLDILQRVFNELNSCLNIIYEIR